MAGLQQVFASLTPLERGLPKVLSPELEEGVASGLHCSNQLLALSEETFSLQPWCGCQDTDPGLTRVPPASLLLQCLLRSVTITAKALLKTGNNGRRSLWNFLSSQGCTALPSLVPFLEAKRLRVPFSPFSLPALGNILELSKEATISGLCPSRSITETSIGKRLVPVQASHESSEIPEVLV